MTPKEVKRKNNNIIYLIVAVFFLFLAILFSYYFVSEVKKVKMALETSRNGLPSDFPTLNKIHTPKVLYNLAGLVEEKGGEYLMLEATIPQIDEEGRVFKRTETRTILIGEDTKFSRLAFVSQEGSDRRVPQKTSITFAQIRIGDYVEVISNRDVSKSQEIYASQIKILP